MVFDGTNYNILKYDDDYSMETRNHVKGIIWFTADGDGSFNIELRFWDKSITHFIVLSRCVEGKVNLGFNVDIFNVAHNSSGTFYFEDINMNGREIKNLGDPTDDGDGTNKKYVDIENAKQDIAINSKFDKNGGTMNGDLIMVGDIYMNNNDIVGVKDPRGDTYCANKKYVDGEIAKVNIDTTPLLPRNGSRSMFGDLDMDDNHILNIENLTDYEIYNPLDLNYRIKDLKSVVNKEYLNENFLKKVDKDGREYYDLKQIVIKNSAAHDDGSYDNDTLVSKAFVDAEISKLPKPDIDVLKLDGSKAMTGNLNMGDHAIIGIRSSSSNNAALTVGGAKSLYVSLNGMRTMQGNLNMGGFAIINIKPFVEDDSSQAASDAQRNEVINIGYFKDERGELKRLINSISSEALNRKDPDPMEDDIDMANHSIINLKEPEDYQATYAANVKFVANAIVNNNTTLQTEIDSKIKASEERSIQALQQENVFEKVMTDSLFILEADDINQVAKIDKDFHKVNQQTYQFKIDYDSSIGYYSTRLGINVVFLPIGYYTIVFEMYFSNKIDVDNTSINANSGTLSVNKINTKNSSNHTRSVVNFYKNMIHSSDDELEIDIALKNKTGQSYDVETNIYVVVYGVSGYQNDVDVRLWDRYLYIENKKS